MGITVEQTMERPDAVLFAQRLDAALAAEKKMRKEFYRQVDENKKMEFINGEIFFQSPVKLVHNQATRLLCNLMGTFVDKHKLGFVGIEKIMISLSRNDYEPDICFFNNMKSAHFTPKQMQFPAPDMVVEVLSNSTERNDREIKFQDYAAHGVTEYWIIDPETETVEQYVLHEGEYDLVLKARDGNIELVAIDGLRFPISAMFDGDDNLQALRSIIDK